MLGDDLREALGAAIPADHARQSYAVPVLAEQLLGLRMHEPLVLDLGAGAGGGIDHVRAVVPRAWWLGVDIAHSAEVDARAPRPDAEFRTFDGVNIPVDAASVDLVYSQQVFEHVERPEPLLADVARVLKPGGVFCGSLSQMEPFHSRSVGGFTPYGWKGALQRAGLQLTQVRPGLDAGTLMLRRLLGGPKWFDRYWVRESPGNRLLGAIARIYGLDAPARNALKLMFAGQFTFVARKPQA